jgi:hypothetical protein
VTFDSDRVANRAKVLQGPQKTPAVSTRHSSPTEEAGNHPDVKLHEREEREESVVAHMYLYILLSRSTVSTMKVPRNQDEVHASRKANQTEVLIDRAESQRTSVHLEYMYLGSSQVCTCPCNGLVRPTLHVTFAVFDCDETQDISRETSEGTTFRINY